MTFLKCDGQCMSRRNVVETGARVGIAAATAAVMAACGGNDNNKGGGDSGGAVPVTAGVATLAFTSYPNLQNPGGSYRINVNGNPISVTRLTATSVVAVLAVCTHQGATLNDFSGGGFTCPRHGATFTADGTVTGGPAGSSLSQYQATIGGTGITVKVG